ncbi:hypothetical protein PVAP13_2KG273932 [Panicum virgatum]|uniref:Uncharacterized protein n=1 Tax=Panicum virgatum TaxID=38727 RepID=A0A8T0WGY8_PANVG|nr:hypothetical protein PVAP13_2KG273932 [Panicum virgatum]
MPPSSSTATGTSGRQPLVTPSRVYNIMLRCPGTREGRKEKAALMSGSAISEAGDVVCLGTVFKLNSGGTTL